MCYVVEVFHRSPSTVFAMITVTVITALRKRTENDLSAFKMFFAEHKSLRLGAVADLHHEGCPRAC